MTDNSYCPLYARDQAHGRHPRCKFCRFSKGEGMNFPKLLVLILCMAMLPGCTAMTATGNFLKGDSVSPVFHVNQDIICGKDGKTSYRLNEGFVYHSPRYGKSVTLPDGYLSDGATGTFDIVTRAWWVHDKLCDVGMWDDGTKVSNWQASQVLQDILTEEGRVRQGIRWFWTTWLLGGGAARENGMLIAE